MYKVNKNKFTGEFEVVELSTDHIICSHKTHKEAYSLYVSLNKGFGFEGWTPAFFLNRFH